MYVYTCSSIQVHVYARSGGDRGPPQCLTQVLATMSLKGGSLSGPEPTWAGFAGQQATVIHRSLLPQAPQALPTVPDFCMGSGDQTQVLMFVEGRKLPD